MNNQLFRFLFCASLLWIVCFPILTAEAKGSPARVIITGAGMETPLEITDTAILQDFGIYGFEVVSTASWQKWAGRACSDRIQPTFTVRHLVMRKSR